MTIAMKRHNFLLSLITGVLGATQAQTTVDCSTFGVEENFGTLKELLASFSEAQKLEIENLICPNNGLGGSFPSEIGELVNLRTLNLDGNKIEDKVPEELSQLINLETLSLSDNCLTGDLLPKLGPMLNLTVVNLHKNKFSGSLELISGADWASLTSFEAKSNDFDGGIPEAFNELISLITLVLDDNRLDGDVPDVFSDMIFLETLKLSDNDLKGSMPDHSANDTDVQPGSKLKGASLAQRWKSFTLPSKCPNRMNYAISKLFDQVLIYTVVAIAFLGVLVLTCLVLAIRHRKKRKNNVGLRTSEVSTQYGTDHFKVDVYLSQSKTPSPGALHLTKLLKSLLKPQYIRTLMTDVETGKVDELQVLDSAAFVVLFTQAYLDELTNGEDVISAEVHTAMESGLTIVFVCLENAVFIASKGVKLLETAYETIDMSDEVKLAENYQTLLDIILKAQAEKEFLESTMKG